MKVLKDEKESKELKFNRFLNKTIKQSSKNYYVRELLKYNELTMLDDANYEEYVKQFVKTDEDFASVENENDFMNSISNTSLLEALKSLSCIERTVIFLLFEKQFTSKEASQILKICSDSVTRIKRRALKKLEGYMKGGNK